MALVDLACNARRLHHVVERFVVPMHASSLHQGSMHACCMVVMMMTTMMMVKQLRLIQTALHACMHACMPNTVVAGYARHVTTSSMLIIIAWQRCSAV